MRKILIAISFFTRFPIKLKDVSEEEFYDSMIFMPLVGLLVGAILFAVSWVLSYIHVIQLQALFTMIVYIWITGGLHLDGFADTVDALFSARDHAKMREIMKDSRLGSFGAIGLILLNLRRGRRRTGTPDCRDDQALACADLSGADPALCLVCHWAGGLLCSAGNHGHQFRAHALSTA